MRMRLVLTVIALGLCALIARADGDWTQQRLERWLGGIVPMDDFVNNPEPEYVPLRNRDALKEFSTFITDGGWTTNQLVRGLIAAATNNMEQSRWEVAKYRDIAWTAVSKLAEIDHPEATSFITTLCTNDVRCMMRDALRGVFRRSDLDGATFDYLRKVCVMTNRYDQIAGHLVFDLLETLETIPDDASKHSATNNLASYFYFTLHHITNSQKFHDATATKLVPSYSNSVQRLRAMQYVSSTATNAFERAYAEREVGRLRELSTLTDIPWIEQDVHPGSVNSPADDEPNGEDDHTER